MRARARLAAVGLVQVQQVHAARLSPLGPGDARDAPYSLNPALGDDARPYAAGGVSEGRRVFDAATMVGGHDLVGFACTVKDSCSTGNPSQEASADVVEAHSAGKPKLADGTTPPTSVYVAPSPLVNLPQQRQHARKTACKKASTLESHWALRLAAVTVTSNNPAPSGSFEFAPSERVASGASAARATTANPPAPRAALPSDTAPTSKSTGRLPDAVHNQARGIAHVLVDKQKSSDQPEQPVALNAMCPSSLMSEIADRLRRTHAHVKLDADWLWLVPAYVRKLQRRCPLCGEPTMATAHALDSKAQDQSSKKHMRKLHPRLLPSS